MSAELLHSSLPVIYAPGCRGDSFVHINLVENTLEQQIVFEGTRRAALANRLQKLATVLWIYSVSSHKVRSGRSECWHERRPRGNKEKGTLRDLGKSHRTTAERKPAEGACKQELDHNKRQNSTRRQWGRETTKAGSRNTGSHTRKLPSK